MTVAMFDERKQLFTIHNSSPVSSNDYLVYNSELQDFIWYVVIKIPRPLR